jgi:hypothetical protein
VSTQDDRDILSALQDFLSLDKPDPRAEMLSSWRHSRPDYLFPGTPTCDLSPSSDLPPLERDLQHKLLEVIDQFGEIANQINLLGIKKSTGVRHLDEYSEMWSDAVTAAFSQVMSQVNWYGNT